jgi:hypothetical protein
MLSIRQIDLELEKSAFLLKQLVFCLVCLALSLGSSLGAQPNRAGQIGSPKAPARPPLILSENMGQALIERGREQLESARTPSVFHGFSFADRFSSSGTASFIRQ